MKRSSFISQIRIFTASAALFASLVGSLYAENPPKGNPDCSGPGGKCGKGDTAESERTKNSLSFWVSGGFVKLPKSPSFANISRVGILQGAFSTILRDFDELYLERYEKGAINRLPLKLEFQVPKLSEDIYDPAILEIHHDGIFEQIDADGHIKQVLTDTGFTQVDRLESPALGFSIRVWSTAATVLEKVDGFYEEPTETPLTHIIFQRPAGATGGSELLISTAERFGALSGYDTTEHLVQDFIADTLVSKTYSGIVSDLSALPAGSQLLREESLTYSNRGTKVWDYTLDRVVKEAPVDAAGNLSTPLQTVSATREVFADFSLSAEGGDKGARRMMSITRDPEGDNITTTYDYHVDDVAPVNPFRHGRLKSVINPDQSWSYYEYADAPGATVAIHTVYKSYKDVPFSNYQNGIKEVTEISKDNFTRTTSIAGQQIAKSDTSRSTENGDIMLTKRTWSGSEWATATTSFYPDGAEGVEAGRMKWVEHPDGTATTYEYFDLNPGLEVSVSNGQGDRDGVVGEGTYTVTLYNAAYEVISEETVDIASGLITSSRTSIDVGGGLDPSGRPTKWVFNGNADDYSITQYGCCGVEFSRDRNGATVDYYRDALKRVYRTESKRSSSGQPVYTTTAVSGLTTTRKRHLTPEPDADALLISSSVRSLGGLSVTGLIPDADGDDTPETTTRVMVYNANGGSTTTITYPDNTTTSSTTFIDGRRKSSTDQENYTTTYEIDTHNLNGGGLVTQNIQPGGSQWVKSYSDQMGRNFRTEYPDGAYAANTYHSCESGAPGNRCRLSSSSDPDQNANPGTGSYVTYDYSADGDDVTTTRFLPDNQQRVTITEEEVIPTVTLHGTEIAPAISTVTKVNGITTLESYRSKDGRVSGALSFDLQNLSITTVPVDGAWTTTSTSAEGAFSISDYSDGLMTQISSYPSDATDLQADFLTRQTMTHDTYGRTLSQEDARTGTTIMGTYLENNALTGITAPGNRTTIFTYDNMGRRTQVDAPDSTANGANIENKTQTSYTDRGQVEAIWGDQTYPRFYVYDAQGRMNELRTYQSLDHNTQPTESTPGAAITEWKYHEQRGWLTEKNYAGETDNGRVDADYQYTLAGRLVTRAWERGITTSYFYNQGFLQTVDYSDTTPDLGYTYDNFGRLTDVTQGGANHASYLYDPINLLLTTENLNQNTAIPQTLSRTYDTLLRPGGINAAETSSLPAHSVSYVYDPAGRLQAISNNHGDTFTYGYQALSGNLIETCTTPSHITTNTWDLERNVLLTKENKVEENIISSYVYSVNDIGQRTAVDKAGSAFVATQTLAWDYNARGEITAESHSDLTKSNAYQYDAIGNRIEAIKGTTVLTGTPNYTANALNQYTDVGTLTPSYDLDGNATAYPVPAETTANAAFEWDAENRLVKLTTPDGTVTDYQYDYLSRRINKTQTPFAGNSVTTSYLYDGWNCVAERGGDASSSLSTKKFYTWGLDLSGSMQGAGGVGGLLAVIKNSVSYYPTYDGNGNVSEYLTDIGTLAAHFEYDAFANLTVNTDAAGEFNILFSTKKRDEESGLYYYGYRYYDPVTGKWPSRDPLEENGGENLLQFNQNNGINSSDYLGLEPKNYKTNIVSKSFINGIPKLHRGDRNGPTHYAMVQAGALFGGLDAFDQYPEDDAKDGLYRLYSRITAVFCCTDEGKLEGPILDLDKEGGKEGSIPIMTIFGIVSVPIEGTINQNVIPTKIGESSAFITFSVWGRPNHLAEVGMQSFGLRTSKNIWHRGNVIISCKGNKGYHNLDRFSGSRFPSHKIWINSNLEDEIDQGFLSDLWVADKPGSAFVK